MQQARSAFAQAEAQLTAAQEALEDLIITAPFAGRIELLDLDAGEFVQAGSQVSFVGTSAAETTRTFLAEVTLPNEDGAIAAGISARITIPTTEVTAHFMSPSIVSLSPAGQLGVKIVDDEDIVRFHPIEVVRADRKSVV